MQQVFHIDKDSRIIGGGSKHRMAVPERLRDNIGGIGGGHVVHRNFFARSGQFAGEDFRGVRRIAVNRTVGDQYPFLLGGIGAPFLVFFDKITQAAAPDKPVQRADHLNVHFRGFFEHRLHLGAVFADDIHVIPPRLGHIIPVKIHFIGKQAAVKCAEGAERIGRKQDLSGGFVGHHHFRPVHHWR